MALDPDIMCLRALWDQVDAMVRECENVGEDMSDARHELAYAEAMLDHAERLRELEEER